jgi:hypothetical protein
MSKTSFGDPLALYLYTLLYTKELGSGTQKCIFHEDEEKGNFCHVFIKSIFKSVLANVEYNKWVFQKAFIVWRSKKVN